MSGRTEMLTCQVCGGAEQEWWGCDRSDCTGFSGLKFEEWVRGTDHREAVDALRAIAEDRIPHPHGYDVAVPPTVQAYAQGALSRLGGK